jgi:predicted nucleotidyltransferase
MVGESGSFSKSNELAIYARYERKNMVSGCGLKKILPPDTTINESSYDNSPYRRIVKGRIWAIGRV